MNLSNVTPAMLDAASVRVKSVIRDYDTAETFASAVTKSPELMEWLQSGVNEVALSVAQSETTNFSGDQLARIAHGFAMMMWVGIEIGMSLQMVGEATNG